MSILHTLGKGMRKRLTIDGVIYDQVKEVKIEFNSDLWSTNSYALTCSFKGNHNLSNKNIVVEIGFWENGHEEPLDTDITWYNFGTFIVMRDGYKYDDKTGLTSITKAFDKMILTHKQWNEKDLNITYPITINQMVRSICELVGLELNTQTWNKDDILISEKLWSENSIMYREILDQICELCNVTMSIEKDQLLIKEINKQIKETIVDGMKSFDAKQYWGNINVINLSREPQHDNYVYPEEFNLIPINERVELVFENNQILDQRREELAPLIFADVKDFGYTPFEYIGYGYLKPKFGDYVEVIDKDNISHFSYVTKGCWRATTGFSEMLGSNLTKRAKKEYALLTDIQKKSLQVYMYVDKANGQIVSRISDAEGNINKTIEDVKGISKIVESNSGSISTLQQTSETFEIELNKKASTDYIDTKIKELESIQANLVSTLPMKWEQGKIDDNGQNVSSGYHIRTINFYRVQSGPVTLQISPMLDCEIFLYDENYAFIKKVSTTDDINTFTADINSFFKVHVFNGKLIKPEEIENSLLKVENNNKASAWSLYPADILADVNIRVYQLNLHCPQGLVVNTDGEYTKTIIATVLRNELDITATFTSSAFIWTRQSDYPDLDNDFNSLGKQGATLVIESKYLTTTATYSCKWTILGDVHNLVTMDDEKLVFMDGEEWSITTINNAISRENQITIVKDDSKVIAEQATSIKQTNEAINLAAKKTEIDLINQKINSQDASLKIQSDKIEAKVSSTDFNGDKIIGLINVASNKISINAVDIDMKGIVTFSSLSDKGKSSINGGNIQAKTITVNHLNVTNLSAISSNLGSITGGSLNINSKFSVNSEGVMTALSGQIGGWAITDTRLHTLNGSGGLFLYSNQDTGSPYNIISINSSGMTMFYVKKDGLLYARNADIAGKVTATSGEFKNITCTNLTITGSSFSGNASGSFNGTSSGTGNFTGGYHTGASSFVGNSGSFGGGYHNNGSFSGGNFGGVGNFTSGSLAGNNYFKSYDGYTSVDKLASPDMKATYGNFGNQYTNGNRGITCVGVAGKLSSTWLNVVDATSYSDIRLKENFKDVHDEFNSFIYSLPIGTYNFKNDSSKTDYIGVNANFVDKMLPKEYTKYLLRIDDGGFYNANYTSLVPMLVKVVQSQNTRLIDLEYEIKKLKGEL